MKKCAHSPYLIAFAKQYNVLCCNLQWTINMIRAWNTLNNKEYKECGAIVFDGLYGNGATTRLIKEEEIWDVDHYDRHQNTRPPGAFKGVTP